MTDGSHETTSPHYVSKYTSSKLLSCLTMFWSPRYKTCTQKLYWQHSPYVQITITASLRDIQGALALHSTRLIQILSYPEHAPTQKYKTELNYINNQHFISYN